MWQLPVHRFPTAPHVTYMALSGTICVAPRVDHNFWSEGVRRIPSTSPKFLGR
jgi:hypothetical protein